jgi:hypothetical protein
MTSLRRRMTEDMQVRNLSLQTQATYVQQVSLFARHFNKSPEILGPDLDDCPILLALFSNGCDLCWQWSELLLHTENRILGRLGDAEFQHGFGGNLDLLFR